MHLLKSQASARDCHQASIHAFLKYCIYYQARVSARQAIAQSCKCSAFAQLTMPYDILQTRKQGPLMHGGPNAGLCLIGCPI